MLLEGKTVIVTGIGPGLGRVFALEAARMGADVAMVSRSISLMDEVAGEIAALGRQSLTLQADVTVQADCDRVAAMTVDRFNRIDGLVNGAYSPGPMAPVVELDPDDIARAFDVTVYGALRMIKAIAPIMERQGGGSIVNVGSQVVRKYLHDNASYAASKAALATFSRYLAVELGPHNIRVNTPAIGWTMSAPARAWLEQQAAEGGPSFEDSVASISTAMALRRVPGDEEAVRCALMPLSDLFSAVTGATLDINGGDFMPL